MRNFHFISSKKKFPFSPQIFIGQQQRERERLPGAKDHGGGLVDGAEDKALQQPKTKEVAGAS